MLTCRSNENGRHSLKVWLLRKLLKNSGHVEVVKLVPMLESNGRGSVAAPVCVATCILLPVAGVFALGLIVVEGVLSERSCLASNGIRTGGSLRSNKSSRGSSSLAP